MTNLADFLLARIAEDEVTIRSEPSTPYYGDTKLLAECQAKRRIIAAYQDAKHHYDEEHDVDGSVKYGDGAVWTFLDKLEQWERAVKILAAVYADHPDFDPSWRGWGTTQ